MVDNCSWKWGTSLQTDNSVSSILMSVAAISPIIMHWRYHSLAVSAKKLAHWLKGNSSFKKHIFGQWHFGHFLQIHVFRPVTESFEYRLVLQYFRCVSIGHCCLVLGGHEYNMSALSIYFALGLVYHRWLPQKEAIVLLYPPHNEVVGGYIGFTPSVPPSVCPSSILCMLCSAYSFDWIRFIFIHLINQLQKSCRVWSFLQNLNFWQFFKNL